MSGIKVGDRVTVIGVTPNESFEGCKGTIVRAGVFHEWIVDVTFPDGNHDELGYDEFELTATAQPAPAHAAEEGDPYAPTDMTYTTSYDALVFHILNAKVAALPENTWRNDWTPAQTVNELVFEIGRLDHDTDALRAQLAATEARLQAAEAFYTLMVNIDVLGDIADSLANEETWEVWGELAHLIEVLRGEWNPLQASEKGE